MALIRQRRRQLAGQLRGFRVRLGGAEKAVLMLDRPSLALAVDLYRVHVQLRPIWARNGGRGTLFRAFGAIDANDRLRCEKRRSRVPGAERSIVLQNQMSSAGAVIAGAVLAIVTGSAALADPCEAIPDKGPMPAYLHPGGTFRGPVVYVGDGASLCVAVGRYVRSSDNWVEVRLADVDAPALSAPGGGEAKKALERIAMGQRVWCWAQHRAQDRVVANCTINGRGIGKLMRAAGVAEGGRGR